MFCFRFHHSPSHTVLNLEPERGRGGGRGDGNQAGVQQGWEDGELCVWAGVGGVGGGE